jgi:O-antigen/teichoic acid export membrane protein
MEKHAKKIAKGSLSVILAAISIIAVSIAFNPILVRLIGKQSFGTYALLLAVYSLASPLVAFGIFNSIRKTMGESKDKEKKKVAFGGYRLSFIYSACAFGIGLAVVLLLGFFGFVQDFIYISLLIIVFSLSLFVIYEAARSILFGLHKERTAETLRFLEKFIAALIGLILVYLGFGIPGIFMGILFSLLVVALIGYFIVKDKIGLGKESIKDGFTKYKGAIFSFGGLTLISMLLAEALYDSDILLIGFFLNTESVGAYKAALVLARLLWLIPLAFQTVLLHYVSEIWSKGKSSELEDIITGIAKYVTLIMILFGFGLLILAGPFVTLYFGAEFSDSVVPLQILIIGSLGFGLARVMNPIIEGTGHIKAGIRISAGIVALNITLNILLIPIYGITGAAIATSISYFAKLIQYSYLLKSLKIHLLTKFPKFQMLILAVAFPLFLYFFIFLPIPGGLTLIVIPVIGFGIFMVLSWTLGLLRWREVKNIVSLLRG